MAREKDEIRRADRVEPKEERKPGEGRVPPSAEKAPADASKQIRAPIDLRVHTLHQENDESGGH
jgi:hypothetical protein